MKAPNVRAKTLAETAVLPTRTLVAAPVNCEGAEALAEVLSTVGVASSDDVDALVEDLAEDMTTLVDDGVTTDVDAGSKVGVGVAVEAGTEPSVGVSDCSVVAASTIAAVTDS